MRQDRPVVATAAALLLAGCSGGLGSVQGHDIPVNQAVFLDLGNNRLFLAVGNPDNLCDLVTGAVRPGKGFAVLFTEFANWDGTTTQPLPPGRYVQSTIPGVPGLVLSPASPTPNTGFLRRLHLENPGCSSLDLRGSAS
jgi:hypothetical protein